MKKRFTLEPVEEDFRVYAINSHAKGYSLCWKINQQFKIDLERVGGAVVQNSVFVRYNYKNNEGQEFNVITNRSKEGYFIPDQKAVNYFLVVNKKHNQKKLLEELKKNSEILFAFELELEKANTQKDLYLMRRKTKIIATIGPATRSKEMIKRLISRGVNVCRLNFSHIDHETAKEIITSIKEVNRELHTHTAILADLQGPKIRVGQLPSSFKLVRGKK